MAHVIGELDLDAGALDRDAVLDVAKNVAHQVARPAAPLTAYLVGVAVGRGAPLAAAAETVNALAAAWTRGPQDGTGAAPSKPGEGTRR